jgi:PIN domain nuclease of toxin-antitoxin system
MLWMFCQPELLSPRATQALQSQENELHVSHAALWEISNKLRSGRLPLAGSSIMYVLVEMGLRGFAQVPIELSHVLASENLPFHHSDPFDRIMIAQAISEDMTMVSADGEFKRYDVKLLW